MARTHDALTCNTSSWPATRRPRTPRHCRPTNASMPSGRRSMKQTPPRLRATSVNRTVTVARSTFRRPGRRNGYAWKPGVVRRRQLPPAVIFYRAHRNHCRPLWPESRRLYWSWPAGRACGGFHIAAIGLGATGSTLPPSTRLRFLSPSFLKSVSYRRCPPADGAVSWRLTVAWPQDGQVSGSTTDRSLSAVRSGAFEADRHGNGWLANRRYSWGRRRADQAPRSMNASAQPVASGIRRVAADADQAVSRLAASCVARRRTSSRSEPSSGESQVQRQQGRASRQWPEHGDVVATPFMPPVVAHAPAFRHAGLTRASPCDSRSANRPVAGAMPWTGCRRARNGEVARHRAGRGGAATGHDFVERCCRHRVRRTPRIPPRRPPTATTGRRPGCRSTP